MTSTAPSLMPLWPCDRAALVALFAASESVVDSLEVGYQHDPDSCDLSDNCGCPDLTDPVRDGIGTLLTVAAVRAVGDEVAAELLPLAHELGDMGAALDRLTSVRRSTLL